ncbi:MAG: glutamine--tRNA ligase/YqeY domain fusion protein [Sandaracinaceae bacterium]
MAHPDSPSPREDDGPGNFVRDKVIDDLAAGRRRRAVTRFPPEPNGYLHIGHAYAIILNFELAEEFGGHCNLRFDDTNPVVEDPKFVEAMKEDIRWLGFRWAGEARFASDYFDQLYAWAQDLVRAGKAYVDSQSPDAIREGRGSFHELGEDSPDRDRPAEESLDLLERMRRGELEEGAAVLRARIDMQSKDLKLRDPLMYRIRKVPHPRTGEAWSIYPMYDWAHGQSDAIEGITHSICSLEFLNHHALYDWFLAALGVEEPPEQIEFARLNLTYTVLSKRRLLRLVEEGHVEGWDDPRMPTIAALRRRGIPPEAIRAFSHRVGVSRRPGYTDVGLFEHVVREDLNARTPRVMAVLRPLRVVLTNVPEGEVDHLDAPFHPEDPSFGSRALPFSRVLYVERDDFLEDAPRKWHRLAPGREVRLRYAALITCEEVIKDDAGEVVELRCRWDPDSRGGTAKDGRKVRGTLHWVSAEHAVDAEVRLYDRLFQVENPTEDDDVDFLTHLNPSSREILTGAKLEPSLANASPGDRVQFERLGYFCADLVDHDRARPVWNRTIGLKDSWAKIAARQRR